MCAAGIIINARVSSHARKSVSQVLAREVMSRYLSSPARATTRVGLSRSCIVGIYCARVRMALRSITGLDLCGEV